MSFDPKDFDFDSLEEIEIPFSYKGTSYILKEASGASAKLYTNARVGCLTLNSEGKPTSIKNIGNLEPLLVSSCLFSIGADGRQHPVKQSVVESWPYRIQKKLHDQAKRISGLEEPDTLKQQVDKLRVQPDSPIGDAVFQGWMDSLDGEEYKEFKELFAITPEEKAKNSQEATTDG